jgi:shikimate kinase
MRSGRPSEPVPRHIVLIGLMGVGKTTVGAIVADRLRRPLRDSDPEIEASTGRTVKQILADGGVNALRRHEAAAFFAAVEGDEPAVIAAPGGIVLDPAHRRRLGAVDAEIVWLTGDPELLAPRTATREHRPWLDDDALGTLRMMERDREPLYREVATMTVAIDGLTPDEIADRIVP